jgi:hypothetical protein
VIELGAEWFHRTHHVQIVRELQVCRAHVVCICIL